MLVLKIVLLNLLRFFFFFKFWNSLPWLSYLETYYVFFRTHFQIPSSWWSLLLCSPIALCVFYYGSFLIYCKSTNWEFLEDSVAPAPSRHLGKAWFCTNDSWYTYHVAPKTLLDSFAKLLGNSLLVHSLGPTLCYSAGLLGWTMEIGPYLPRFCTPTLYLMHQTN